MCEATYILAHAVGPAISDLYRPQVIVDDVLDGLIEPQAGKPGEVVKAAKPMQMSGMPCPS